jgi:adenylyltransferase/sulfurtransferase
MTELSPLEKERYSRQILIFGEDGQKKLKRARVTIAGVGGLGCPAALYLASQGVGRIRIIDKDVVEVSNLNRQILHWDKDINKPKVESAYEKLKEINENVEIERFRIEINEKNVVELLKGSDAIIDAMDNFPTRFILNEAAIKLGIPFFHGSIYGLEGRAMTIIPGKTACLRCLFSESPPKDVFPVLGSTPALIAMIQVTEVIKYLTGIGKLLENRYLIYDGETMSFREIKVKRNPECPVCGKV